MIIKFKIVWIAFFNRRTLALRSRFHEDLTPVSTPRLSLPISYVVCTHLYIFLLRVLCSLPPPLSFQKEKVTTPSFQASSPHWLRRILPRSDSTNFEIASPKYDLGKHSTSTLLFCYTVSNVDYTYEIRYILSGFKWVRFEICDFWTSHFSLLY